MKGNLHLFIQLKCEKGKHHSCFVQFFVNGVLPYCEVYATNWSMRKQISAVFAQKQEERFIFHTEFIWMQGMMNKCDTSAALSLSITLGYSGSKRRTWQNVLWWCSVQLLRCAKMVHEIQSSQASFKKNITKQTFSSLLSQTVTRNCLKTQ